MKKILLFTLFITLLIGGVAVYAGDIKVTVEVTPPAARIANDDCTQVGTPITQEDAARLEYTISYRKQGDSTWTNIESATPTTEITGLDYETTYEVVAGAHWPGHLVKCSTDITTFTTPAEPAPGQCSITISQ